MLAGLFSPAAVRAGEPSEPEQALRARVEEFYALLQVARWKDAEAYVTQETREEYHNQNKSPFLGFRVESIRLNPSGDKATVVTLIRFLSGMSPQPVTVPRSTEWHRVGGEWYVEIPTPNPRSLQELFALQSRARGQKPAPPPQLEFKGHRYGLGTIQPGQIKTARFPFTNVADHVVVIREVQTGCECLRVSLEKKEYQPGEEGELAIAFNPAGYERAYKQTIVVRIDPGDHATYLHIHGFIVPAGAAAPEANAEKKP